MQDDDYSLWCCKTLLSLLSYFRKDVEIGNLGSQELHSAERNDNGNVVPYLYSLCKCFLSFINWIFAQHHNEPQQVRKYLAQYNNQCPGKTVTRTADRVLPTQRLFATSTLRNIDWFHLSICTVVVNHSSVVSFKSRWGIRELFQRNS
jgi:hypothetical protein